VHELLHRFDSSFVGYGRWVAGEIRNVSFHSYFWLLVGVSLTAAVLEVARPWRRDQPFLRHDFFLDLFYVFFNFFGFGLLGYAALSDVASWATSRALASLGLSSLVVVDLGALPIAAQIVAYLLVRDFVEYGVHRLLHRVPALWRIHEVHHSATAMGFAAHLRYHPLETVIYRTLDFLPLALFGFTAPSFFAAHAFALSIGHLNHANVRLPWGPFRYVFNSSELHLLHHAKALPGSRAVNFGLTFVLWDFLFGTALVPDRDRRDEPLGFPDVDRYPDRFLSQMRAPFRSWRSIPDADAARSRA
jgi:sterol desaturase/sphingolipid hydroxylase (fatty acid hydroxylase superfamily)